MKILWGVRKSCFTGSQKEHFRLIFVPLDILSHSKILVPALCFNKQYKNFRFGEKMVNLLTTEKVTNLLCRNND